MDLDSIECVSSSDGLDEDEIHLHHTLHPYSHSHHHPELSASKPRNGNNNSAVNGPTATAPATSVHELLECPVCTNSMYPPIHQVCLRCPNYFRMEIIWPSTLHIWIFDLGMKRGFLKFFLLGFWIIVDRSIVDRKLCGIVYWQPLWYVSEWILLRHEGTPMDITFTNKR